MMGANFSMAANERRREMAVLRAVGAMPGFVFRLMLTEAALLAAGGAVVGTAAAALGLFMFKEMIAASLKLPFLFPSVDSLVGLFGAGLALSAFVPAAHASRLKLAISMRE